MSSATQTAVFHLVNDSAPQAFVTLIEAVEEEARGEGIAVPYIAAGDGFRRLIVHRRTRHLRKPVLA